MNKTGLAISLLLFLAAISSDAHAYDTCEFYQKYFKDLYDVVCTGFRYSSNKASVAGSSFSDSFNLTPAALPTEPTPYGLESILSYTRTKPLTTNYVFALVKGFKKIGTGLSTASNNTFYGNDVLRRGIGHSVVTDFNVHETPKGKLPNLNLGTSVAVFGDPDPHAFSGSLGLSIRYNQITDTIGWGSGVALNSRYFLVGGGLVGERVSNTLPQVFFYSGVVGIKLPVVELEYMYLKNSGGYHLDPIQIWSATGLIGKLFATIAFRKLNYKLECEVLETHYALQYQFNRRIAVGYLFNYIYSTNSLAAQFFL